MGHGGARPGAGRKSDADIQRVRTLMAQAVTDSDWRDIFTALALKALAGNTRAAELLMAYAFGKPPERLEVEDAAEVIYITVDV